MKQNLKEQLLRIGLVKDNEFLNKYVDLIYTNKNRTMEKFSTQGHHIIPRYFKKIIGDETIEAKENLVNLLFSDHLLAHYYLMKCSSTTEYELANANAIIKSMNNPHSIGAEQWLLENKSLLQKINKRRCKLISLHHSDVSGVKNPRATKVYQYQLNGQLEVIYPLIRDCAIELNYNPDSFRAKLSKNKLLIINNKVYSKDNTITKDDILKEQNRKAYIASRTRHSYKFICSCCGQEYNLLLNIEDYKKRKLSRHYCYECTKSGINFRGIPKSPEQKEKMRQAYRKRTTNYEKRTSN